MRGFYEELGDRLRIERLRKRKSLQEVADRVEVSKNTVMNWENGKHKIDMISLVQICRYLDIDVKSILNDSIDSTVF